MAMKFGTKWAISSLLEEIFARSSHLYGVFRVGLSDAANQARREGGVRGVSYPGPCNVWRPHRHSEIKKYIRMHHFEKIQKFLPIGAPQKCLGPHENVSPGPTVALEGPAANQILPLPTYIAMATKFETKCTITWLVSQARCSAALYQWRMAKFDSL